MHRHQYPLLLDVYGPLWPWSSQQLCTYNGLQAAAPTKIFSLVPSKCHLRRVSFDFLRSLLVRIFVMSIIRAEWPWTSRPRNCPAWSSRRSSPDFRRPHRTHVQQHSYCANRGSSRPKNQRPRRRTTQPRCRSDYGNGGRRRDHEHHNRHC